MGVNEVQQLRNMEVKYKSEVAILRRIKMYYKLDHIKNEDIKEEL